MVLYGSDGGFSYRTNVVSSAANLPKNTTNTPTKVKSLKAPEKNKNKISSSWTVPESYYEDNSSRRVDDGIYAYIYVHYKTKVDRPYVYMAYRDYLSNRRDANGKPITPYFGVHIGSGEPATEYTIGYNRVYAYRLYTNYNVTGEQEHLICTVSNKETLKNFTSLTTSIKRAITYPNNYSVWELNNGQATTTELTNAFSSVYDTSKVPIEFYEKKQNGKWVQAYKSESTRTTAITITKSNLNKFKIRAVDNKGKIGILNPQTGVEHKFNSKFSSNPGVVGSADIISYSFGFTSVPGPISLAYSDISGLAYQVVRYKIDGSYDASGDTIFFKAPSKLPISNFLIDKISVKICATTHIQQSGRITDDRTIAIPTVETVKSVTISKPIKPTLEDIKLSTDPSDNHKVSCKIKDTTKDDSLADRYDTEYETIYERGMYYSYTKNNKKYLGLKSMATGKIYSASGAKTAQEFTVSLQPKSVTYGGKKQSLITGNRGVDALRSGEYLRIKIRARNRGMAGPSDWTGYKSYLFAYPHKPVIKSISKEGSFYRLKFEVSKETYANDGSSSNAVYKTTKFVLQRCANYRPNGSDDWNDATWLSHVEEYGSFNDVSNKEVGPSERYFLDNISDGRPTTEFARTYYRIKAENDVYPAQYSKPFVCPDFHRVPSATNEKVKIVAAGNHDAGNALKVLYVYKVTKTGEHDNSNGTELSWSEHEYAWESTDNPSTFDAEDIKFKKASSSGNLAADYGVDIAQFPCYSIVYIMGLTPGIEYTLKARRYLDKNRNEKNYGSYDTYSEKVMVFKDPGTVDVTYGKYIIEGKDFYLSWVRSSEEEQKKYEIQYTDVANAEGEYYTNNKLIDPKVLLEAESSDEGVIVKYSDYENKIVEKNNGSSVTRSLYLSVRTSTDKRNYALSKPITIEFVKTPEVSISGNNLYMAQPLSFTIFTNDPETSLILKVRSYGVFWLKPDGIVDYAENEVLYSEKSTPSWEYDSSSLQYYTNVTLPYISGLVDNGKYKLEAIVVNEETGLSSEVYDDNGNYAGGSIDFDILWAHQAKEPGPKSYAIKVPGSEQVYIYPDYPSNYDGDVCDIYRVTPDGAVLVGSNKTFGRGIYDNYAPFTNQSVTRYILCTRTLDGDLAWKEIAYYYHGYSIRFDWLAEDGTPQGPLLIPYNLSYSDSYEKQFESRMHMDGSNDGYWQPGIKRSGSFSTDLIRLEDYKEKELVRSLARHNGPVYVRRPDGSAYTANVVVNNVPNNYNSLVMNVSFNVEEITMSELFTLD